jgi:type II secretion system protein H
MNMGTTQSWSAADRGSRHDGFTLIELMLVAALLAILVGLTVVRLEGVSETGRLRAAARQVGAVYRTARIAALTDGRPRLVSYTNSAEQGTRLRIQCPRVDSATLQWQAGEGFRLAGEIRVSRIVQDGELGDTHGKTTVLISSDGVASSHVVVLALGGKPRAAVAIDGVTGEDRFVLIEDPQTFDPAMLLEASVETTGTHAR